MTAATTATLLTETDVVRFTGESISTADWLAHLWEYWNQFPVKVEALRKVKWDVRLTRLILDIADVRSRRGSTARA